MSAVDSEREFRSIRVQLCFEAGAGARFDCLTAGRAVRRVSAAAQPADRALARGTLPLALFGPHGFGRRVGVLSLPARATGAMAPLAVGLLAEHLGAGALWVTALASISAFVALFFLRVRQAP